jgi:hypothetical protein
MDEKKEVKRTGIVKFEMDLPYEFTCLNVGDIVIQKGWPHIVIDAGPEQGKRIAAFRKPYSIEVR